VFWECVKQTYCVKGNLVGDFHGGKGGAGSISSEACGSVASGAPDATVAARGEEEVDEAAFGALKRDVTLLTASHYFTIVPLHETRPRQLRYLQQARKMLREEGLL
jgi:hypothetical protein